MFKVMVGLEEVAQVDNLAGACQMFIKKIKEAITNGGMSKFVLYESCMILTQIDGVECLMNFHAIVDFSSSLGILQEDGSLRNKPVPYIPKDLVRQIFLAAHSDSLDAFLAEQQEQLTRIANTQPMQKVSKPEPPVIIAR